MAVDSNGSGKHTARLPGETEHHMQLCADNLVCEDQVCHVCFKLYFFLNAAVGNNSESIFRAIFSHNFLGTHNF